MQNSNENTAKGAVDGITEFLQRNRKTIFITVGILVLILVGAIATISVMSALRSKAIAAVEELSERYDSLKAVISEEDSSDDITKLLTDLETFAKKNSGYAGGRAWYIAANIYSEKKEWEKAETTWVNVANTAKKTYMAPLAWFNAGAAAEEQNKTEAAIGYYSNSLTTTESYSSAPRAQFSIGRLKESLGDNAAALDAYRAVISGWPQDTTWNNLSHSRIISIEAKSGSEETSE